MKKNQGRWFLLRWESNNSFCECACLDLRNAKAKFVECWHKGMTCRVDCIDVAGISYDLDDMTACAWIEKQGIILTWSADPDYFDVEI